MLSFLPGHTFSNIHWVFLNFWPWITLSTSEKRTLPETKYSQYPGRFSGHTQQYQQQEKKSHQKSFLSITEELVPMSSLGFSHHHKRPSFLESFLTLWNCLLQDLRKVGGMEGCLRLLMDDQNIWTSAKCSQSQLHLEISLSQARVALELLFQETSKDCYSNNSRWL